MRGLCCRTLQPPHSASEPIHNGYPRHTPKRHNTLHRGLRGRVFLLGLERTPPTHDRLGQYPAAVSQAEGDASRTLAAAGSCSSLQPAEHSSSHDLPGVVQCETIQQVLQTLVSFGQRPKTASDSGGVFAGCRGA